jgi:hypothetical protein
MYYICILMYPTDTTVDMESPYEEQQSYNGAVAVFKLNLYSAKFEQTQTLYPGPEVKAALEARDNDPAALYLG